MRTRHPRRGGSGRVFIASDGLERIWRLIRIFGSSTFAGKTHPRLGDIFRENSEPKKTSQLFVVVYLYTYRIHNLNQQES